MINRVVPRWISFLAIIACLLVIGGVLGYSADSIAESDALVRDMMAHGYSKPVVAVNKIELRRSIELVVREQRESVATSTQLADTSTSSSTVLDASQESEPSRVRVLYDVPFISQAPFGDWKDPRQQDGCEEASVIMAMRWVRSQPLSVQDGYDELQSLSHWEDEVFGFFQDTSAQDTRELFVQYYDHSLVRVIEEPSLAQIISELDHGHLVIAPMNGQVLHNPHFTLPGPERHMVLVIGYDTVTREFITHDPGTRYGSNYRYDYDVFMNAMRDYPSGEHLPILAKNKAIIVVEK